MASFCTFCQAQDMLLSRSGKDHSSALYVANSMLQLLHTFLQESIFNAAPIPAIVRYKPIKISDRMGGFINEAGV